MNTLGFTGTRKGMAPPQRETVARLLNAIVPAHVRHGSAPGADTQFHILCREAKHRYGHPVIILHPGPKSPWLVGADQRLPSTATYIERDRHIVEGSDLMIATPLTVFHKSCRDGTCATARYALKIGTPLVVVLPTGAIDLQDAQGKGHYDVPVPFDELLTRLGLVISWDNERRS